MDGAAPRPDVAGLFAVLPVAVLVTDGNGRVTFANGACEALLNMSERLMRGHPLDLLLRLPADSRRESEHGFAAFDAEITTLRGTAIRADYNEAPVPDHAGWRVVTLHDTAAAHRFGHAADRAGGARAAIGAAAMLAHEIKNPLSGIRGAAQLLAQDAGEGELTTLIVAEVDRIAALIDRMQRFTDTRPLPLASANIYPLLDHARRVALAGFASGVELEERFDPSLPDALVNADALVQVVLNLIKNASEATAGQRERRVVLATAFRHGMSASPAAGKPRQRLPIEIAVLDNGPGAPADIADQLFDPFVSGRPEGQGLGLALVDKLVRDMGGIVQYAREGMPATTVFRLLLPRAA